MVSHGPTEIDKFLSRSYDRMYSAESQRLDVEEKLRKKRLKAEEQAIKERSRLIELEEEEAYRRQVRLRYRMQEIEVEEFNRHSKRVGKLVEEGKIQSLVTKSTHNEGE